MDISSLLVGQKEERSLDSKTVCTPRHKLICARGLSLMQPRMTRNSAIAELLCRVIGLLCLLRFTLV